jgi:hypothetical protein
MRIRSWAFLVLTLCLASSALARDEIIELPFQGGVNIAESQGALRGVKMSIWSGVDHPPPAPGTARELTASKRTRRRGNDQLDCHWAMAAALKELAHDARAIGADTVFDVRSNWKHRPNYKGGFYECALGGLMVGVALRATAVLPTQPAAVPPPQPPASVGSVITTDQNGQTAYELLLGNPQVSIKLVAVPDREPERVSLALTFRVEPGTKDIMLHQTCNVSAVAGTDSFTLGPPTYERGNEQETLHSSLTVGQLRVLVNSESALLACDTRVNLRPETRRELGHLLQAIEAHPRAAKAPAPSANKELSL